MKKERINFLHHHEKGDKKMFKKLTKPQIKTAIAIALIVIGVIGLVLWEGWGREKALYAPVLVASQEIYQGQEVTPEMLAEISVPVELVIQNAFRRTDAGNIIGKVSKQYIPVKSQIVPDFFYENDFYIKEGQSLFYCPASWFGQGDRTFTTTIRRGETVEFWSSGLEYKLGDFLIAFARDGSEKEVTDKSEQKYADPLDRIESTGIVNHFEIVCTLNEYKKLYNYVYGIELNMDYYSEEQIVGENGITATLYVPNEPVEKTASSQIFVVPKVGNPNK